MIRALILAYDFPPLVSAGAGRPYGWFLYLKENGIDPVVLTRHWDEGIHDAAGFVRSSSLTKTTTEFPGPGTVIRVPHRAGFRDRLILRYGEKRFRLFRKTLSFLLSWIRFWLPAVDNTREIYIEAKKYLTKNKINIIIATGEPFILFKHAFQLSKTFDIPYFLDYRDAWTTSLKYSQQDNYIRLFQQLFFRHFERRYFLSAKAIITASPTYVDDLKIIAGNKKIFPVLNGYLETAESAAVVEEETVFTMAYAGTVYDFQPLHTLLGMINKRLETNPGEKIKLWMIGNRDGGRLEKNELFRRMSDEGVIRCFPPVEYPAYMRMLKKSHLLLLLAKPGSRWLNAKLFDYLAAGRRIWMVMSGVGLMEDIITETNAGMLCHDEGEMQTQLDMLLDEFKSKGSLRVNAGDYSKYSRRAQTAILADLIKSCVE